MSNLPVPVWRQRLDSAREVRKRVTDKTQKYVNAYLGRFDDGWTVDDISMNWCRRVIDAALTNLWFRSPTVEIPPVKGLDHKIAHASGTMINQVIEEAKVEGKFRSAIFNGLLFGCGWVRFGYHTQFPTEDQIEKLNTDPFAENDALALEGQIREPQEGEDHARHITVHQALLENPEIIKAIISKWGLAAPIKLAAHIEKHRQLKEKEERRGRADWRYEPKQVWCESVDPREVVIDPNATCLEDAQWIAFRLVKPVADVKRDPALSNTRELVGGDVAEFMDAGAADASHAAVAKRMGDGGGNQVASQDPEDERVELWDIWDRKTQQRFIVCDQHDKYLYAGESPYEGVPGFFPCVQIVFSHPPAASLEEEAERAYGESQIAKFYAEQIQLNALSNVSLELTKSTMPRYVAAPGVDETFIKNLEAGVPGGIAKLSNNYKGDPRTAVVPVQLVGNTADLLNQTATLRDVIQFKSGFSEIQLQGISSAKTATASQVQATSASAVIDSMLSTITTAFVHAAKIVRSMIVQFYTQDRVVELTGEDGVEYLTIPYSVLVASTWGSTILVKVGSQSPSYDAMKMQSAMLIYNLMAQNPFVKIRELTKWVLGTAGLTRSPEFIFSDAEVAQMEQQKALMAQQEAGAPVDANAARASMNEMAGNGGPQPDVEKPPLIS